MECLFCRIVAKEIPAYIVYEDDRTLAFLDVAPHARGHTVVISKRHSENLIDLPDAEIGPLFAAVKKIAARIASSLRPDGFTIGVNHGGVSGQTIPHLHIHVMPRYAGDGGGSVHSVVDRPPEEGLAEIQRMIRI